MLEERRVCGDGDWVHGMEYLVEYNEENASCSHPNLSVRLLLERRKSPANVERQDVQFSPRILSLGHKSMLK
jgi:hypothetical protein